MGDRARVASHAGVSAASGNPEQKRPTARWSRPWTLTLQLGEKRRNCESKRRRPVSPHADGKTHASAGCSTDGAIRQEHKVIFFYIQYIHYQSKFGHTSDSLIFMTFYGVGCHSRHQSCECTHMEYVWNQKVYVKYTYNKTYLDLAFFSFSTLIHTPCSYIWWPRRAGSACRDSAEGKKNEAVLVVCVSRVVSKCFFFPPSYFFLLLCNDILMPGQSYFASSF